MPDLDLDPDEFRPADEPVKHPIMAAGGWTRLGGIIGFVTVYLVLQGSWSQTELGLIGTIGGLAVVACLLRAGSLDQQQRRPRE